MYLHVVCVVTAMLCPQDLVCDWLQMQFLHRVVTGVNCDLLLIDLNEGVNVTRLQGYSKL